MNFTQEYEFEARNGATYFVEVVGNKYSEEDGDFVELLSVTITDELGEEVGHDHAMFNEIYDDAESREYEVEEHAVDTSFYGDHESL